MKVPVIKGTIGHGLEIHAPPEFLRREILGKFSFPNPVYEATLKFSPYARISPKISPYVHLAWGDQHRLVCPRGVDPEGSDQNFSAKSRAAFRRIHWDDQRQEAPTDFPKFKILLNKEQCILFDAFKQDIQTAERFGTFLYVSPTGTGKTLLLLRCAHYLKQRTLILFNTDQVKKAWQLGLEQAYGLRQAEIGMLQQQTWNIKDPFTLGSIQTIARRKKRWEEIFAAFGTLIVDESDLVTAPSYWNFVLPNPARFILGATATDRDEHGSNHYLRACFGATRKRIRSQQKDTATSLALRTVETVNTDFQYTPRGEIIDWNELTTALMMDEERNQLIVHKVLEDLRNDTPCLVVTKRLAHVELLVQMIKDRGFRAVNRLTGETNADEFYTDKLVRMVLAGKLKCIVATMAAIKRGANLNPLAALHLAMPTASQKNLEQLVGRIRRRATDKVDCKLVYYLDLKMPYLFSLYKRKAIPTFRRLRVPAFSNVFVA
jgi:superfamily II DNA or RNA helicase